MKFSEFTGYIEKIESTSSRLTITHLLADLFKKLSEEEIAKAIYLMTGRVAPAFQGVEFGVAEKMAQKSAILAMHLEKKYFEKELKKMGDFGLAVEHFKKQYSSFDRKDLSILEVYTRLHELATKSGPGSQEAKISILAHLITQLDPVSTKYLVRIPIGAMRLGFSDMTVLDALSWMLKEDKSLRPTIEKAYHVRPDLGQIAAITRGKNGIEKIKKITPVVYTPIIMMRAERLSSGEEIINKIGECAIESKYDGFRLQIHYKKGHDAKLYSRNLEEVSFMYPDIVEAVKKQVKSDEVIFEGEAIGYDPYGGNFLPFQETVQRKRKYGIEEKVKEIPLRFFVFEILYRDGKSFLEVPFSRRREEIKKIIKGTGAVEKDILIVAADHSP